MSEQQFPVYRWSVRCMIPQRSFTDPYVDHIDREDCMAGWEWMRSGNTSMLRSEAEFNPDAMAQTIIANIAKKYGGVHAAEVTFSAEIEWKTWHLAWFCHETYATFASDSEALESFEEYVYSVERYNRENARMETFSDGTKYWNDSPKTLMGAEDRWRWRGENDGDPAPCKCAGCKKFGITRINH